MKNKKIASSPTIEGLAKLINVYFYSTTYKIEDMKLYNSKGLFKSGEIKKEKGKFNFYQFT